MDAEGKSPSLRVDRIDALIMQLEDMLAELDGLGFSRIALPVNEAIELARATTVPLSQGLASDRV